LSEGLGAGVDWSVFKKLLDSKSAGFAKK